MRLPVNAKWNPQPCDSHVTLWRHYLHTKWLLHVTITLWKVLLYFENHVISFYANAQICGINASWQLTRCALFYIVYLCCSHCPKNQSIKQLIAGRLGHCILNSLIDWFCYLYIFAHQDRFPSYHKVAMSLYCYDNFIHDHVVAWLV